MGKALRLFIAFVAVVTLVGMAPAAAGNTQIPPDESFRCDFDGDGEDEIVYEAVTTLIDGTFLASETPQGMVHLRATRLYRGAEYALSEGEGYPETVFVSGVQLINLIFDGELGDEPGIENVHLAQFVMPRFDVHDGEGNLIASSSSVVSLNPSGRIHIQESGPCADFEGGLDEM